MSLPVVTEAPARRALQPTGGFLAGFTHSLNPYVGCAFGRATVSGVGCPFCYVAESPVQRFAAAPWGEWVRAKTGLPARLATELRHEAAPTWRVFVGSATDPYQGAEARHRLMRGCLEAFAARPPAWIVLQTRSVLARRDLDLIAALRGHLVLSVTLETIDEAVRRRLTPTSPTVAARLALMAEAKAAGALVQAAISPLLPGDPEALAAALDGVCDRVVLDTFFAGDGSGGRRSARRGMPALLAEMGHGGFWHPEAHREALAALVARLGPERVRFSVEGFARGLD